MDKVIGLDLGTTTLGIAYSDYLGFVHGLETFRFPKNQFIVARKHLHEVVEKLMIKEIVIGMPYHLSGNMSDMAESVNRFIEDIKKEDPGLIIHTMDERLSSVTANNTISELGYNHDKRKQSVDRIAACVILDTYIRKKERENANK